MRQPIQLTSDREKSSKIPLLLLTGVILIFALNSFLTIIPENALFQGSREAFELIRQVRIKSFQSGKRHSISFPLHSLSKENPDWIIREGCSGNGAALDQGHFKNPRIVLHNVRVQVSHSETSLVQHLPVICYDPGLGFLSNREKFQNVILHFRYQGFPIEFWKNESSLNTNAALLISSDMSDFKVDFL